MCVGGDESVRCGSSHLFFEVVLHNQHIFLSDSKELVRHFLCTRVHVWHSLCACVAQLVCLCSPRDGRGNGSSRWYTTLSRSHGSYSEVPSHPH